MSDDPIYLTDEQMETLKELTKLSVDEVRELRKLAQLAIKKKYENQQKKELRDEVLDQLEELSKDKYIDQKSIGEIVEHFCDGEDSPYVINSKACSTYTLEKIKEVRGLKFESTLDIGFIKFYTISIDYTLC